jgi:hypothetical protein
VAREPGETRVHAGCGGEGGLSPRRVVDGGEGGGGFDCGIPTGEREEMALVNSETPW